MVYQWRSSFYKIFLFLFSMLQCILCRRHWQFLMLVFCMQANSVVIQEFWKLRFCFEAVFQISLCEKFVLAREGFLSVHSLLILFFILSEHICFPSLYYTSVRIYSFLISAFLSKSQLHHRIFSDHRAHRTIRCAINKSFLMRLFSYTRHFGL